ncbi:Uncharacterised protein [Mycobacteroides abscessus subsp. abscessus]|nr:Uncharacterised protein [Mycobacteroides abscessus subsp. abscessus]
MYRSARVRPPQYSVIGRFDCRCRVCSSSDLIGAKPVPDASMTMGASDSSRRKKEPSGISIRWISRSFIAVKTCSVKMPPGMRRMCNSTCRTPSLLGTLAIE